MLHNKSPQTSMTYNYKPLSRTFGSAGWLSGGYGALLQPGGWLGCSHSWPIIFSWRGFLLEDTSTIMWCISKLRLGTGPQFFTPTFHGSNKSHQIHVNGTENDPFLGDRWGRETKYLLSDNLICHITGYKTLVLGSFKTGFGSWLDHLRAMYFGEIYLSLISPFVNWR